MTNLAEMLSETVAEHGDRIALKLDDLELPYSVVEAGSARVAGLLAAKGVEAGDPRPYYPGRDWNPQDGRKVGPGCVVALLLRVGRLDRLG
jgi:non-ribosomal peptide synthetase component F